MNTYLLRLVACLFLCVSLNSFGALYLNDGLVAHYEFEGNLSDSSQFINNGINNGGVIFNSGVIGQAAYFDGNDDFINIPHSSSLALNRTLSISLWVKPEYNSNSNCWRGTGNCAIPILVKNSHTGNNFSIWTEEQLNRVHFQQYPNTNTSEKYTFRAYEDLSESDFTNIIVVRDNSELNIYIRGINVLSETINYSANEKFEDLFIGSLLSKDEYDYGYDNFKGSIDELRIYSRALSISEVSALASPVPLPAGIYLFLSGLVGLGLMRGRRSKQL